MSMMSGCQPSAISLVLVILVFASMPLTDECVSACYVISARYTWHSFIFFIIDASYFCIYLIKKITQKKSWNPIMQIIIRETQYRFLQWIFKCLQLINKFDIFYTNILSILWTQYEKSVNLQIIIEQRIDWIYDAKKMHAELDSSRFR